MKNALKVVLPVLLLIFLTSCMVNRHTVGDGPVGKSGRTEIYSSTKQMYLFWGIMPLGFATPDVPKDGNYQIKTSFNIVDDILTGITGGVFSMRTVRVIVKK